MATTGRRYSKEEFVRRGTAIYERDIRPLLQAADKGKYVAVDIETGGYEIANDVLSACHQLRARIPDPQPWLVRVGYPYVYRFGGHGLGGRRHDGRGSGE